MIRHDYWLHTDKDNGILTKDNKYIYIYIMLYGYKLGINGIIVLVN